MPSRTASAGTVVIPPSPELLGALGRRAAGPASGRAASLGAATDLLALAAPEMKLVGRFTCGACKMYCSIDRFEVAGRRFPFGGRCSLYENVWKRKARTAAAPDLVGAAGRDLLFGRARRHGRPQRWQARIGIPRGADDTLALSRSTRPSSRSLGMEVVLSGVDPRGELKSYSGFCFPAQIAHGAVLDLVRQGVNLVFLPHVMRMPQPDPCRDSYLCPITQASPYFLAKAFPERPLPLAAAGFHRRLRGQPGAGGDGGARSWEVRREQAEQAWAAAVRAQTEAERAHAGPGQQALEQALARRQADDPARRPQLQRLHAGGVAIGRQEALQHGRDSDPRRLPGAGRRRARRPGTSPTRS